MTLAVTGGASPANFSGSAVSQGATPLNPLTYTPATGVLAKTNPASNVRESGAIVGSSTNLVSTLTLSTAGLSAGDTVGYGLISIPTCVTTRKVSLGGTGTFTFANTNLSDATNSLTTTAINVPVTSATAFVSNPLAAVSIAETLPASPPGWRLAAASCTDANSAITGNTGTFGTRTGDSISLPPGVLHPQANITCEMRNSLLLAVDDTQTTLMEVPVSSTASIFANDTGTNITLAGLDGSACTSFPCVRNLANGTLSVSATGNYTFSPASGFAGVVTVPYQITDAAALTATANIIITVTPTPKLSLAKSSNGPWAVQQSGALYNLSVSNNGTAATTGVVTVRDSMPAGITAVAGTYGGWSCAVSGQDVTCTSSAPIAVAGVSTINLPVTVGAAAVPSVANSATVGGGGDPANGGTAPAPGSCAVGDAHCSSNTTAVSLQANLSITKTASPNGTYVPGQALNYQIVVSNAGPSDANGASVTDNVPANVTVSSWSCTPVANCGSTSSGTGNAISLTGVNLASGQSITISVSGVVQLSATGDIVNSASVTPPAGVGCSVLPCDKTSSTTNTNSGAPALRIQKSATPAAFAVGQPGTYSILVGNTGTSSTVGPITVNDTMPAGVSINLPVTATGWDCSASSASQLACTTNAVLLPGSNAPVINAPVSVAAGAPALVSNNATVSGGGASCTTGCQSTVNTSVNTPRLDVVKTLSSPFVVGVASQYVITATNNGQAPTLAGTITDEIPAGLAIGALPAACAATGQTVTCQVPAGIATGGAVSFTIPVTPQPSAIGQSLVNTAQADANTGDPSCPAEAHCSGTTDNPVTAPQLSLTKQSSVGAFTVGVPAQYVLTLSNTGTAATTEAAVVTDTMPAGLTIDTASLPAACTQVPAGSQTLVCTAPAGLASGASTSFTIGVTAQNALNGQSVSNQATASGGGDPLCAAGTATADLPARCKPQSTTAVDAPQLTLTKTAASLSVGVPSSYTLTVTNTGTAPTNAPITVTDLVPSSMTLGTLPAGCTAAGQQVNCVSTASLAAGNSISYVLPVTPQASAAPSVSNSASVQGGGDPTCPTTDNCKVTNTTAVDAPSLQLSKTDNGPWVVGQAGAQYTLTVTNTNASVATVGPITVRDSMPAGITPAAGTYGNWVCTVSGQDVSCTSAASIAGGSSDAINLPVTVTAAAVGGATGDVTNHASVGGGGDPYNGGVAPQPGAACTDASHCTSKLTSVSTAAALSIAKALTQVNGAASPAGYQAQPGDTLTYTITVTNSGGTLGQLTLTETVSAGTSYAGTAEGWSAGDCTTAGTSCTQAVQAPAASSAVVSFTVLVDTPLAQAAISNAITSDLPGACGAGCTVSIPAASANVVVATQPPISVAVGSPVTVVSSCTNQGPAAARNADCVVSGVPADATNVSTVCTVDGAPVTPPVANLASGAAISCTTTFTPASPGVVSITTAGRSNSYDPDSSSNTASTGVTVSLTPPALALTKTSAGSVVGGESLSYTLTVTNSGQTDAAAGVLVYDQLPAGMVATAATGGVCTPLGSAGALLSCTLGSPVAANGGTAVIVLTATAPDVEANLTNYASVDPAGGTPALPGPGCTNCASATTAVSAQPGLVLLKTNNASSVTAGSVVTYTVTIRNPGSQPVSGLSWSDAGGSGLSDLAITGQSGDDRGSVPGSCTGLTCSGITVAAGGIVSYTVSGKVSGTPGSTATNTASLVGGRCTVDAPCTSTDSDAVVSGEVIPVPLGSRSVLALLELLLMACALFQRHVQHKRR
ncbi:beta strand repeat-containing protein [Comamonas koreensis]